MNKKDAIIQSRKADHIRINSEEDVQSSISTDLEKVHLIHEALPESNLDEVDISTALFNKPISAPILISSMTGGTADAARINKMLAKAASELGLALAVGSQRAAIEQPQLASTYQVRQFGPIPLLFANLGAVQLNMGYGIDECLKAIEMIEADALILHLNPLQEALQPDGNTHFANLLSKIEMVCKKLPVPVIIKEVGWGISARTANMLAQAGVAAIDVAGAGGTSWSQVESFRISDAYQSEIAGTFKGWGIPTAKTIQLVKQNAPNVLIFASGGLRNGLDIAKCLALGTKLGGVAHPLLLAANISYAHLLATLNRYIKELQICLFLTGRKNIKTFDTSVIFEDNQ